MFCSNCFLCDDFHYKDLARVCSYVVFDKIAQVQQLTFEKRLALQNFSMCHKEIESVPQSSNMISWFEAILREQEILNLLDVLHIHVWQQHVIYLLIKWNLFDFLVCT